MGFGVITDGHGLKTVNDLNFEKDRVPETYKIEKLKEILIRHGMI